MFSQKAFMTRLPRILCALILFGALTLRGQSFNGKIAGVVTDSTASVIPSVAVTVTNEGTGYHRRVITDANGGYVAAELPVGFYTVRVEAPGMSPAELRRVKVDVGGETRADVSLSVQAAKQSVDVIAEVPVLQQDSGALNEVVDTRQLENLPINGRDFRKLAFLLPGSAPRSPRGSLGSFTVDGQREKSNIFLIDGVDNNDSFRNQASFNQGGVVGAQATLFPVDALAELSVQSQGSAEYGRNSGAVVNAVIKSGTNDFHGTPVRLLPQRQTERAQLLRDAAGRGEGSLQEQ